VATLRRIKKGKSGLQLLLGGLRRVRESIARLKPVGEHLFASCQRMHLGPYMKGQDSSRDLYVAPMVDIIVRATGSSIKGEARKLWHACPTIERMFDRTMALSRVGARQCACPGCAGVLTDPARSRGGWSFCRSCRCAWKTSTIDGQEYATAIHAPVHTLAPSDPPADKRL